MRAALISLLLTVCSLAAYAQSQAPCAPGSGAGGSGSGSAAEELRIYIDPATGKPGVPRAAQQQQGSQPAAVDAAVSTSHEGLRMRPGTTRAGGVILDLGGRFQDDLRIQQGPQGGKVLCDQRGTTDKSP